MNNLKKQKRLSVAFNGDIELIDRLAEYPQVDSIFGKLSQDIMGGGRPTYLLANIDFDHLKKCVTKTHQHNITFIYLLNAACQSNYEFTRNYNNKLISFISKLVDIGVTHFTVASPYIVELLKNNFPNIKVSISTFSLVTSPKKAKVWENLGADRIMIGSDQNRNFIILQKIRKAVKCEIEIFANNVCLFECPFRQFHSSAVAHASSSQSKTQDYFLDYFGYKCINHRLQNPSEFLKGGFIRPEDIKHYQDIGIDVFKIAGRRMRSDWIMRAVKAYVDEKYEDNLAEIIPYPILRTKIDKPLKNPARGLLRTDYVSLDTIKLSQKINNNYSDVVRINNKELNGFIEHFKTHNCQESICDVDCKHCQKYAEKAVSFDQENYEKYKADIQNLLTMFANREVFKKNPPIVNLVTKVIRRCQSKKSTY